MKRILHAELGIVSHEILGPSMLSASALVKAGYYVRPNNAGTIWASKMIDDKTCLTVAAITALVERRKQGHRFL